MTYDVQEERKCILCECVFRFCTQALQSLNRITSSCHVE